MPERFYHPSGRKLKYSLALFAVLFIFTFSSLVYTSCSVFVQCSPEEIADNPLCTQACAVNFNILLFIIIVLVSYLIPAAILHYRNR